MRIEGLRKAATSQVCVITVEQCGLPINKPQNGVGAFILQCKRLDFHYCDWAGSSRGMKSVSLISYDTFS